MSGARLAVLGRDATVFDVAPSLSDPKKWLLNVIATLRPIAEKHPDAAVRIGITGEGKAPYHLITFTDDSGTIIHKSCFGLNTETDWGIHPDSGAWSSRSSTLADVRLAFNALPESLFRSGR